MNTKTILLDHVDMRPVTANDQDGSDRTLVKLDPDHPGFRDPEYLARRNSIAEIALTYRKGEPIPPAPYTSLENEVWSTIWTALEPAHKKYAVSYTHLRAYETPEHLVC